MNEELPNNVKELRHIMSNRSMSFARGNVFKACYRLGLKEGTEVMYDLKKIKLFIGEMIEMFKKGEMI